jgi:hypothetical protein
MATVPGSIVDPSGGALVPLTGRDEPLLRSRLVRALPLPSRVVAPSLFLAAPDGASIADPGGVMVGWPLVHVSRMLSAGRAARTRGF